jgi:hypothetical protein
MLDNTALGRDRDRAPASPGDYDPWERADRERAGAGAAGGADDEDFVPIEVLTRAWVDGQPGR